MPGYYPIMLKIEREPCLVIGGGEVATRKVTSLLENGALVTVISPEATGELQHLAEQGEIIWHRRELVSGDTKGRRLVICATNQRAINRSVAEECRNNGVLLNVVDAPNECDFIMPSVVKRGDLTIAVSTGGSSPLLAGNIRAELEAIYGPEYVPYLELLRVARQTILSGNYDRTQRRELLERLVDGNLLRLVQNGRMQDAKEWVKQCLS